MTDTVTTNIFTVTCPHCQGNMHAAIQSHIRYGETQDGIIPAYYHMNNLEIIGGCEHAELVRNTVHFIPEHDA
jgi:uncharacterized protein YuzB (UPF0349 family)